MVSTHRLGAQSKAADVLSAQVRELSTDRYEVSLSLSAGTSVSAVEVSLSTSSGVMLRDYESLVGSGWITSLSDDAGVMTFAAVKFSPKLVTDVVRFVVETDGPGEESGLHHVFFETLSREISTRCKWSRAWRRTRSRVHCGLSTTS